MDCAAQFHRRFLHWKCSNQLSAVSRQLSAWWWRVGGGGRTFTGLMSEAVGIRHPAPRVRSSLNIPRPKPPAPFCVQSQSLRISSADFPVWYLRRTQSPLSGIEMPLGCVTLAATLEKGRTVSPDKMYAWQGKMFTGQTLEFSSGSEPFSQYTLSDGTVLRVKAVLIDAVRLDTYADNGDPVYQFQFQQVLAVLPPDSLKRKSQ